MTPYTVITAVKSRSLQREVSAADPEEQGA